MTAPNQSLSLDITTASDHPIHLDRLIRIMGQDATGYFTLAPGHADFVTALVPSVLAWTDVDGQQGFAATLDGILILERGRVFVSAAEAYLGSARDLLLVQVKQRRAALQAEADRATQKATALDSAARRRLAALSGRTP
jgi:F-type H+-transporting ATPase subunit epsilon